VPDLNRAIAGYPRGLPTPSWCTTWQTTNGNFIAHVLWYNYTCTPFTYGFAKESLKKANFGDMRRVFYRETKSRYPETFVGHPS
jgi:hypothetical protein